MKYRWGSARCATKVCSSAPGQARGKLRGKAPRDTPAGLPRHIKSAGWKRKWQVRIYIYIYIAYFKKTLMDFLQNENGKEKDECKLVAFCTRKARTYGCAKCGRTSPVKNITESAPLLPTQLQGARGLSRGREGTCGMQSQVHP